MMPHNSAHTRRVDLIRCLGGATLAGAMSDWGRIPAIAVQRLILFESKSVRCVD